MLNVTVIRQQIEAERFVLEVRAVSGRPEAAALRLARRLNILALSSRTHSAADYRRAWLRRYCEGWSYHRRFRGF